jgi:hypothetical protein
MLSLECAKSTVKESHLDMVRRFQLDQLDFVQSAPSEMRHLKEATTLVCNEVRRSLRQERPERELMEQKVRSPQMITAKS